MPTVTLIGRPKGRNCKGGRRSESPGMTVTLPVKGKLYRFQKDVVEKGIPDEVAAKCLKVNDREGYLKFRVEDYPSTLQKAPSQNVHGDSFSPVEPERVEKRDKVRTVLKKKKKAVQGSL